MRAQTEVDIRKQLKVTSERLFRSGLAKADAGDLSRAKEDLNLAVRYNKYNQRARNLLGLVEFRMGEIGEALKQWGISEYLNPHKNRATYYMKEIRSEERLIDQMAEAVHLYNEALSFAREQKLDFAITRLKKAITMSPTYVRAHLLLALCYIETNAYKAALSSLDQVAKIDPLNPDAMHYRLYISQQREEGTEDVTVDIKDVTRDVALQKALSTPKEKGTKESIFKVSHGVSDLTRQMVIALLGLLLGIGFMGLLYVPERVRSLQEINKTNETTIQALETENELLKADVSLAKEVLEKTIESGEEIPEVTLSELRKALKELTGE